ncbi:MAG TPA: ATP-dependent zinc metalloprotease FtsH [Patescibacteria group bacterium]|nr:ATP-dependent zinc metalloprotease FtsH [Patescibacteria group bacterium]
MKPSSNNRSLFYIFIIILGLIVVSNYFNNKVSTPKSVAISQIAEDVRKGDVKKVEVRDNDVTATLNNGSLEKAVKESTQGGLKDYGITPDKTEINVIDTSGSAVWYNLASIFLPILLIGGLIFFMLRSAQGANSRAMSFGKSTAKLFMGNKKIIFADVAGAEEAKQELFEVVDFLRNPKKYRDLGAEIPRGVLLVGSPGTGKTLMARAVAGEAGVPFFSISASEFVEMFVGVGASRVRDLFLKAKRNAPAIIFIDELDAVGRQRGSGLGGSHDEREQTLNQILVEMDGFEVTDNVIVVAATNRPDVLDPALLRPGRFDRQVYIDLPDRAEREAILKVHTKNKPVESRVNLAKIAASTPGFSGADLKNLTNEAAIMAARENKKTVTQEHLNESIEKVMMGPEKRSKVMLEQEKKITAFHEAGHAVVSHILPHADPVHKISIISRRLALGYTWNMPTEERKLQTKAHFLDEIATLMGGRVSEEAFFGKENVTTGAQNDMKRATQLARSMVTEFGMSDRLGPQTYGRREEMPFLGKEYTEHRNYSEDVAKIIDEEVTKLIADGHDKAELVVKSHKKVITEIADDLLKKETIDDKEFLKYFENKK